jgi:hypothetical protein
MSFHPHASDCLGDLAAVMLAIPGKMFYKIILKRFYIIKNIILFSDPAQAGT